MSTQAGQAVNLVSVNTAPERAKVVIGTVIENVKDKYSIVHAGNTTSEWRVSGGARTDHTDRGVVESCVLDDS